MAERLIDELLMTLVFFGGGSSGGGGGGGVTSYAGLSGKPKINGVEILGDQDIDHYEKAKTVEVPVAGWSASAVTVDGASYFTNEITFTKIYSDHPDVNIDSAPGKTVPTAAERTAFGVVVSSGYIACDKANNKIICYSEEKPASGFYIFVKGAE